MNTIITILCIILVIALIVRMNSKKKGGFRWGKRDTRFNPRKWDDKYFD